MLNGYLLIGSLWWYMDNMEYPLSPHISPVAPGPASAQWVDILPLSWLLGGDGGLLAADDRAVRVRDHGGDPVTAGQFHSTRGLMLHPGQHIHVIGVGGFGMSAIARVLLQQGYTVSGSDLKPNDFTRELAALSATIYEGHRAENIAGAELVVATSAAADENPEIAAALAQGIPVRRRRDILGELMAGKVGIAVAGTHGKTTTTALLAHVLIEAGLDPSYIVGGVMKNTGTNAGVGQGPHFVIEADEYDRMFLGLQPQIAIVTNIEHDHPDCFPALADVVAGFEVCRAPAGRWAAGRLRGRSPGAADRDSAAGSR
jgi:hypothetical protein